MTPRCAHDGDVGSLPPASGAALTPLLTYFSTADRRPGRAINDTFHLHDLGKATAVAGRCGAGVVTLNTTGGFDYIVTMEDLARGQRVGNYSIEGRRVGSDQWEILVPPVPARAAAGPSAVEDRPDGHDPRDSYIGHRRIDTPIAATGDVRQVRFNCIRVTKPVDDGMIHLRQFSLHKAITPWGAARR